jgi:hypothetical protein
MLLLNSTLTLAMGPLLSNPTLLGPGYMAHHSSLTFIHPLELNCTLGRAVEGVCSLFPDLFAFTPVLSFQPRVTPGVG